MITLCGFPFSNYYNKVKIALIEKGVAFDEAIVKTGSTDEAVLSDSPLGKVPYIRTPSGALCESQVILEYLEAQFSGVALLPTDPYAAAKVRELCTFIDLHLELVARELYSGAFFGGTTSDSTKARVRKVLDRNIIAFKRLAKFSPFVAGDDFSMADCAAYAALPALGLATKATYGEDLLDVHGVPYKAYLKLLSARPSIQRVAEDRKAAQMADAAEKAAQKAAESVAGA